MPSWVGFDTTTPQVLPSAAFVMAYYNGAYAWPAAQLARFPAHAMIDVLGHAWSACSILQIDGTAADVARLTAAAPGWIRARNTHVAADTATIYCNRSQLPAVQQACHGLSYWVWLATLDGTVCLDALPSPGGQLAAVQGWTASMLGFHADASCILSESWYRMHGGKG